MARLLGNDVPRVARCTSCSQCLVAGSLQSRLLMGLVVVFCFLCAVCVLLCSAVLYGMCWGTFACALSRHGSSGHDLLHPWCARSDSPLCLEYAAPLHTSTSAGGYGGAALCRQRCHYMTISPPACPDLCDHHLCMAAAGIYQARTRACRRALHPAA